MLERLTHSYRIGVAPDGLALLERTRGLRPRSRLLAEARMDAADGGAAVGNGLRRLLAEVPAAGRAVTVVLADELARIWHVAPPRGASRMADLEAAAALRFQGLFGAPAAGWKISADWDADRPFLAAAVPAPLLASLQEVALEQRLHLVDIAPRFVAALNGWRKLRRPGAWFAQVEGAVLTLAVFDAGAPAAVRTALVPAGAGRDWFEAHIAREALLVGAGEPALVQVCGAGEGHPARAWACQAGGTGPACMLLGAGDDSRLSGAARLAATGSAA
ncbi:hypothetical protein [Massilia sp. Leaf139]|uniref:hypothetical protein n=1 Tax=Massilia sp. Leaf139 TaxID=1736272 RepID=UPI0006F9A378|nr:hypothetical protein [Massilia sp. Leaf139]KQQ88882.1 hypothetical protein ASF77_09190 [Massilia sp. Leaf139]